MLGFILWWTLFALLLYVWRYFLEVIYLPISGESPCSAHTKLKNLIQKFVREAEDLPPIQNKIQDHPALPDQTTNRTYEDLLSTTIINKVIENYQDAGAGAGTRAGGTTQKRKKFSKKHTLEYRDSEKEYFFGERNLDSTSSISSCDVDRDWAKKSEFSSDDETNNETETSHMDEIQWKENWYLQKKMLNSHSPVPVPMLVPDPVIEARVLIGDRDAEDTTDLSDVDEEFHEIIESTTLNSVLTKSKQVIGGGKTTLESVISKISDDLSTDDEELAVETDRIMEVYTSYTNEEVTTENISLLSLDSNAEKECEYTEKYASLPRQILKQENLAETSFKETDLKGIVSKEETETVLKVKTSSEIERKFETELKSENVLKTETVTNLETIQANQLNTTPVPTPRQPKIVDDLINLDERTENNDSGVNTDEDEKQKAFKGSYSEREKEKWNHPVELENNPYSKTNLEKRLIGETVERERDLIILAASKSSGAKKINSKDDLNSQSEIKGDDASASDSSIEPETPTSPKEFSKLIQAQDISSDSDFSIERTYHLQTGTITEKLAEENGATIINYVQKSFDSDENHNLITQSNEIDNPTIEDQIEAPISMGIWAGVNGNESCIRNTKVDNEETTVTDVTISHVNEEINNPPGLKENITIISNVNSDKSLIITESKMDVIVETTSQTQVTTTRKQPPRTLSIEREVEVVLRQKSPLRQQTETSRRSFLLESLTPNSEIKDFPTDVTQALSSTHFQLLQEVMNDKPEKYNDVPISPPAEYKNNSFDTKEIEKEILEEVIEHNIECIKENINETKEISPVVEEEKIVCKTGSKLNAKLQKIATIVRENSMEDEINIKINSVELVEKYDQNSRVESQIEAECSVNENNVTLPKVTKNDVTQEVFKQDVDVLKATKIETKILTEQVLEQNTEITKAADVEIRNLTDYSDSESDSESSDDENIVKPPKMTLRLQDSLDEVMKPTTHEEVDIEIHDLAQKKLVKSLVGSYLSLVESVDEKPYVKKQPKLTVRVSKDEMSEADIEIKERNEQIEQNDEFVVKERAIISEVSHVTKVTKETKGEKQVYSITARSLPQQVRKELVRENSKAEPHDIVSSNTPTEEVIPAFPKAKSRIEFFERLNRK